MVGPGDIKEVLVDPPSRTYLCGFLSSTGTEVGDEQNEDFQEGDCEASLEGIPSLVNAMWPSAMGMTFHVIQSVKKIRVRIVGSFYDPVLVKEESATKSNEHEQSGQAASPIGGIFGELVNAANNAADETSGEQSENVSQPERQFKGWKRVAFEKTIRLTTQGPEQEKERLSTAGSRVGGLYLDIRRFDHGKGKPRLITLSLVNGNACEEGEWEERESRKLFQPRLEVHADDGEEVECFAEAPAVGSYRDDPDLAQHLLLYRHAREFATGHGCATVWDRTTPRHKTATSIRTEFIPTAKIPDLHYDIFRMDDEDLREKLVGAVERARFLDDKEDAIFTMRHLAGGRDDTWIIAALDSLCDAYEIWLQKRKGEIDAAVDEIRDDAMRSFVKKKAGVPNIHVLGPEIVDRMRAGIRTLSESEEVFRSFKLANEAMHNQFVMAMLQKSRRDGEVVNSLDEIPLPRWRPFQLAFLILTLNSIARPDLKTQGSKYSERELMDLIWFPTGGGKTEAYLGLTAFTLFFRRLRYGDNPDEGAGVSVITRYTLRLLTTQQFERATRLICACEEMRRLGKDIRGDTLHLGSEEFSIGLWIGRSSTPNRFADMGRGVEVIEGAVSILGRLKAGSEPETGADVRHIRVCPWCGNELDIRDMRVINEDGQEITDSSEVIATSNHQFLVRCRGSLPPPLSKQCPFSRDEGIPVKIVDEEIYADPPSVIIGTVDKFVRLTWSGDTRSLFGRFSDGTELPTPDLIIQDELHLISGPLGTMVGLFETAIDLIAMDNHLHSPKIVGSTATIRRAEDQVWGLFKREVRQFPAPELTAGESFFSRVDLGKPGRSYLGIMAPGTSGRSLFLRCCGALLQLAFELPDNVRDPYWTLVSYFNSIRELAGANVLAQDDVLAYMKTFAKIRQRMGECGDTRDVAPPEELTSRRRSGEIPAILQRLQLPYETPDGGQSLDLLLATNMISVGVDVDRLGLMIIQGQPKTTAEYIQASSRVGRQWPGLVLTLANWTRSRDRSHYERFVSYHEAFYKEVEPTSVTPWSGPARDRALSAVLITVLRQLDGHLASTPAALATMSELELIGLVTPIIERANALDSVEAPVARAEIEERIKKWKKWAMQPANVVYGTGMPWDRGSNHMLRQITAPGKEQDGLEAVPNSMRTVEPETGFRLWRVASRAGKFQPTTEGTETGEATDG